MDLILFDIDGTLIDSVKTDDQCFIQSFSDLYSIDLSHADWNDFNHVTDSGLTNEIFEQHFNRLPTTDEILELKNHFYNLLKNRIDEFKVVNGVNEALEMLSKHADCMIAFATGGWRETALLKLSSIDFKIGDLVLTTSNDHYSRKEITKLAIKETLVISQTDEFKNITYVGDGLWDYNTSKELGINFIGIDIKNDHKLLKAGATRVFNDFRNVEQWLSFKN